MTAPRPSSLTQSRLKEVLRYDPETGLFERLTRKGGGRIGEVFAGTENWLGYRIIKVAGSAYVAHRLAWLYMTGEWPSGFLDHIDRIRGNNRWANIRSASAQENNMNRSISIANKSGVKGVCWYAANNKWVAQITYLGKVRHLGYFARLDDAAEFVQLAREMCHEEFACHA